jgi:hypothetical protein
VYTDEGRTTKDASQMRIGFRSSSFILDMAYLAAVGFTTMALLRLPAISFTLGEVWAAQPPKPYPKV